MLASKFLRSLTNSKFTTAVQPSIIYNSQNRNPTITPFSQQTYQLSSHELRFGFELEFMTPFQHTSLSQKLSSLSPLNHFSTVDNNYTKWTIKNDASIRAPFGFKSVEITSPIFNNTIESKQYIQQFFKALNHPSINSQVNHTCGLHIHIDANIFNVSKMCWYALNYAHFETQIDACVANNRRRNHCRYARSLKEPVFRRRGIRQWLNESNYLTIDDLKIRANGNPTSKSYKVNLPTSGRLLPTIEIRHKEATLDFQEFWHWLNFTLDFAAACTQRTLPINVSGTNRESQQRLELLCDMLQLQTTKNWVRHKFNSLQQS